MATRKPLTLRSLRPYSFHGPGYSCCASFLQKICKQSQQLKQLSNEKNNNQI